MTDKLELASLKEAKEVFELIKQRIEWMDQKGIHQWNTTDYLAIFPLSFFENESKLQHLYVLKEEGKVVGGLVLLNDDDRWEDHPDHTFYVHNLVTDPHVKGVGKILLLQVEQLAKEKKVERLRLDCAKSNETLNQYYASLGYELVGTCKEGGYIGNTRQKKFEGGVVE